MIELKKGKSIMAKTALQRNTLLYEKIIKKQKTVRMKKIITLFVKN